MLQNKYHYKINDDWRACGKKRKINKIHPYGIAFDAEFTAPPSTNAIGFLLKPNYNITNKFNKHHLHFILQNKDFFSF